MSLLETALSMIEKYPLCDHCLGRQFAQLGRGIENIQRGAALKLTLTMRASVLTLAKNPKGSRQLRTLASNGFSHDAEETLRMFFV
jgi:tRNA pseudouridine synthase 10